MIEIRENQIEAVLAQSPTLVQSVLSLPATPLLMARQMPLSSGRLDLLMSCGAELLLLELKAVPPTMAFVHQTRGYLHDLRALQTQKKLLAAPIRAFLLCPEAARSSLSGSPDVQITDYSPSQILEWFAAHFRSNALFKGAAPLDYGTWNLHLLHEVLECLSENSPLENLQNDPKTVANKLRLAQAMGLVETGSSTIRLSELGQRYFKNASSHAAKSLSQKQIKILLSHLAQNPFASPFSGGVTAFVESVFTLCHTVRPVPYELLMPYFVSHAGKTFDWKTDKARYNGTRMYGNYALTLGLVAQSDAGFYLTPDGARFHLQAMLQRSIRLVETFSLEA